MATLYITEFGRFGRDIAGYEGPVAEQPAVTTQTVAIGAGSAQSATLNVNTRLVRLHTDAICSILFGTNPTAVAASGRMAANTTEYFMVDAEGQAVNPLKIAVITNT